MAMVIRKIWFPVLMVFLLTTSCKKTFVGQEPDDSYSDNFDVLWNDFDKFYSFFELKNVDWDSLYTVYKPQAANAASEMELFDLISEMLSHLRDGHVNVYAPFETYRYTAWRDNYPENFDLEVIRLNYISGTSSIYESSVYLTGKINNSIGYLWIKNFHNSLNNYKNLDRILKNFEPLNGLIIDIRNNGGGSDQNSKFVASRFLTEKKIYRLFRYRNGPAHDDFTDFYEDYIKPEGYYYSKPVVVLTNRRVFSAAEDFVLAMRQGDNVTFVGDYTGGGSGNPMFREMPNGWLFRLSRWQSVIPGTLKQYENVGLAPDIRVDITKRDIENGRDTILDTAIQLINSEASKSIAPH